MIHRRLALLTVLALAAGPAQPQEGSYRQYEQQLEQASQGLEAEREQTIRKNLALSEAEAERFWPLYRDYRRAMGKVTRGAIKWITDYADAYNSGEVPDAKARDLIRQYLDMLSSEYKIRNRYAPRFLEILPPQKVMRLLQLENRIDLMVRSAAAEQIPLVE